MRVAGGAWLAIALAGCARSDPGPNATGACRLGLAATVALAEDQDQPVLIVPARHGSTALALILDSRTDLTLLSEAAEHRLANARRTGSLFGGRDFAGLTESYAVNGQRSVGMKFGEQQPIRIGGIGRDFVAVVPNFDAGLSGLRADGVLGMGSLAAFDVDFDLADDRLRLFLAEGACAAEAAVYLAPDGLNGIGLAQTEEGVVTVPARADGVPVAAVLDTLTQDIVVSPEAARRIGIAPTQPDRPAWIDGRWARAMGGRIGTLRIGTLALHDVAVDVAPTGSSRIDVALGVAFLRRVHVWMSHASRRLVLQYPARPSPALPPGAARVVAPGPGA